MILLADYCNAVLKTYRDENERCRETSAPKYFANTFSFAEKPILKNNISVIYIINTNNENINFHYVDLYQHCFKEISVLNQLKSYELKNCS